MVKMRIFKNYITSIKNYLAQRKIKIYLTNSLTTLISNQFLKILINISANVLIIFCKITLVRKQLINHKLKILEEDKIKNKKKKELNKIQLVLVLSNLEAELKHQTKFWNLVLIYHSKIGKKSLSKSKKECM